MSEQTSRGTTTDKRVEAVAGILRRRGLPRARQAAEEILAALDTLPEVQPDEIADEVQPEPEQAPDVEGVEPEANTDETAPETST